MQKVMLAVVGLLGLALLCGSGALLAQSDTTNAGNTVDADAADSRLQGTPAQGTSEGGPAVSFGTSGVGGTGAAGTAGTVASGAGQSAGAVSTGTAGTSQSVEQLQQQVVQLQQEVAQLRAQLANANANTGTGGSGEAGVAPSGAAPEESANSSTASDEMAQPEAVAGGTAPGTALRAGTAEETGVRSTADRGEAVVNAIYTGTVRSVSGGRLVLLDEEGKPFTVELGDRTRVLRNGQRIAAHELKKGTRVRAVVDMLSGHNQATEVTTLSGR